MGKTIAIMQPYFLPYIGYWQLLNYADEFVVYDDVEYSKGGWINRNRYQCNGRVEYFTIPLRNASDYLLIRERELSANFEQSRSKLLRQVSASYKKAPFFDEGMFLFESCLRLDIKNLFEFNLASICTVREFLGITTNVLISSEVCSDNSLRREERLFSICRSLNATRYINPIGGVDLYKKSDFSKKNITLEFQNVQVSRYQQVSDVFFPNLSILDFVMCVGQKGVSAQLSAMVTV